MRVFSGSKNLNMKRVRKHFPNVYEMWPGDRRAYVTE